MTAYRLIRVLLLCLFISACGSIGFHDEASDRGAKQGHEDLSSGCIDNQALPERGVDVYHDLEPMVIKRVEPEYPRIAKQAGLTGTVQVAVLVDRCGKVRDVAIEKSSGTQALDDAAVAGVWKWRFRPGEDHGKPVAMWVTVPIEFKLPE